MSVYGNLERTMKEEHVTRKDLAELLDVRYATIIDKMKGRSQFDYDEAKLIKDTKFPNHDIEELFAKDEEVK